MCIIFINACAMTPPFPDQFARLMKIWVTPWLEFVVLETKLAATCALSNHTQTMKTRPDRWMEKEANKIHLMYELEVYKSKSNDGQQVMVN